ncbi:hypothetical protein V9K67_20885 [Paraflavisolibacter sp. H34]|uniref:hypothetical protein n=1 Tax=Huijunlia imazamoxiresistens TaxID=3127457 RepID=UPI00301A44E3
MPLVKRTTRDIDYSVYVKDYETWIALNDYLIQEEGFTRDEKEPYRFYHGATMDLIPFGGMERNGEVFLDNPPTELSVYGCKEVTEEAAVIEDNFKVVTLPGLCIMKLVAYSEKPDRRAKDFEDYLFLVKNYHEIALEELFTGTHDDLIQGDFDLKVAAARMLGRHMAPILKKNQLLKDKILQTLQHQLKGFDHDEIEQMYSVRDRDDKLVLKFGLISQTIKGINDAPASG